MGVILAVKSRCVRTVFERKILCAGTMTDYIVILRREIQGTTVNSEQADELFTEVENYNGHLEAVRPTQRFDGINISTETTHIIYIPFDQSTYELDINTLFADVERTRDRRFKLLKIQNYGEDDNYLALYCKEQGFNDIEANKG